MSHQDYSTLQEQFKICLKLNFSFDRILLYPNRKTPRALQIMFCIYTKIE